jgi:hypothetical protein
MKNLTAARDAVGSEEPIATGGWYFLWQELNQLLEQNDSNRARLHEIWVWFNQPLV